MGRKSRGRPLLLIPLKRQVSEDNGAKFAVVVTNKIGRVLSPIATLTVQTPPSPPTIVKPPADLTVNTPDPAAFHIGAKGWAGPHLSMATGWVAHSRGDTNDVYLAYDNTRGHGRTI